MNTGCSVTVTMYRPSWLPPDRTLAVVPAGRWWDAVAVDGDLGGRVAERVTGPVVCDPLGPVPRWYFLVPVGTADQWQLPGTEALGDSCYVGIPGSLDADHTRVHWASAPGPAGQHVRPEALRRALTAEAGR